MNEISVRANVVTSVLPLPLAHAYGLLVLCGGLHRAEGARTVLMRWFDPAGWVKLAGQHRAQGSPLVPSMIQMLLGEPLEEAGLSELTTVVSGASPLPEQVRREFEARVPSALIYEGYGCTEAASFISANSLGARRASSVGLPAPGCEVSIQDENGQTRPAAGRRDLRPLPWRDDRLLELAGHRSPRGRLAAHRRHRPPGRRPLPLRGGQEEGPDHPGWLQRLPRDVEEVLVAHPAVAQAAVVRQPDARLGEEVVAFVSPRPGAEVTAAELTQYARQHLAAHKYPRQITIVPAVPPTSVGKLDRKKLRTWAGDVAAPHRDRDRPAAVRRPGGLAGGR